MKIKYYGTAAAEGWPSAFCRCPACQKARNAGGRNIRTRSQALIDDTLLVDLPPDTACHEFYQGLPLPDITSMIVTHSHDDHFYPQELINRAEPFSHGLTAPLQIYGNNSVFSAYKWAAKQDKRLLKATSFHQIEPFISFKTADHTITALLANHKKDERCYVYLIEHQGKALLYANDTGLFPEITWDYLKGRHVDLVSMDCTMGKHQDGNYHMGLEDDREMVRRLASFGCIDDHTIRVITHFSHNGELIYDEMAEYAAEYGFLTAYDGFTVEF